MAKHGCDNQICLGAQGKTGKGEERRALTNARVSLEDGAEYWAAGEGSLQAVRNDGGASREKENRVLVGRGLYTVEIPALGTDGEEESGSLAAIPDFGPRCPGGSAAPRGESGLEGDVWSRLHMVGQE